MSGGPPGRRLAWVLAALVFVSYAYFYHGAHWAQNSRLNAIFAFVEPGTPDTGSFRIDRFIVDPEKGRNTGDWARYPPAPAPGHFYSNKAPGPSLLGIPFYALLYHGERALGIDPTATRPSLLNGYLIHLWVTVLPMALSLPFFWRLLTDLGAGPTRRWLLGIALYWGSLCFPFSTQIWGHTTAAAFVVVATSQLTSAHPRAMLGAGAAIGVAALCDYAGLLLALLGGIGLAGAQRWRDLGLYVAGGVPPFLVHAVYHTLCFGSPFVIASSFSNPIFLDDSLGGVIGLPGVEALWGLTFSPYRGVFVFMPFLLLALPGVAYIRRAPRPDVLGAAGVACAAMLLVGAGFNNWHGGAAMGPRYLVCVLPLATLLLVPLPPRPRWNVAIALLAGVGAANMLLIATISTYVPEELDNPLATFYRGLARGEVHGGKLLHPLPAPIRLQTMSTPHVRTWGAFNWGEVAGLEGAWTVLPLLSVLAAGLGWTWRSRAQRE